MQQLPLISGWRRKLAACQVGKTAWTSARDWACMLCNPHSRSLQHKPKLSHRTIGYLSQSWTRLQINDIGADTHGGSDQPLYWFILWHETFVILCNHTAMSRLTQWDVCCPARHDDGTDPSLIVAILQSWHVHSLGTESDDLLTDTCVFKKNRCPRSCLHICQHHQALLVLEMRTCN